MHGVRMVIFIFYFPLYYKPETTLRTNSLNNPPTKQKQIHNILHEHRCKILSNQIQEYMKRIIHPDYVAFISEMQG